LSTLLIFFTQINQYFLMKELMNNQQGLKEEIKARYGEAAGVFAALRGAPGVLDLPPIRSSTLSKLNGWLA